MQQQGEKEAEVETFQTFSNLGLLIPSLQLYSDIILMCISTSVLLNFVLVP